MSIYSSKCGHACVGFVIVPYHFELSTESFTLFKKSYRPPGGGMNNRKGFPIKVVKYRCAMSTDRHIYFMSGPFF